MRHLRLAVAVLAAALAIPAFGVPPDPVPPPPTQPSANYPEPPGTWSAMTPDFPALGFKDFISNNDFSSCANLKEQCEATDPLTIFWAAMQGNPHVGLCTVEEFPREDPFDFETPQHVVEQSWRGPHGAVPMVGAVFIDLADPSMETSRKRAGEILKNLCVTGRCCCPDLKPVLPCTHNIPVNAREPQSQVVCSFPNECTIPPGWSR